MTNVEVYQLGLNLYIYSLSTKSSNGVMICKEANVDSTVERNDKEAILSIEKTNNNAHNIKHHPYPCFVTNTEHLQTNQLAIIIIIWRTFVVCVDD